MNIDFSTEILSFYVFNTLVFPEEWRREGGTRKRINKKQQNQKIDLPVSVISDCNVLKWNYFKTILFLAIDS